MMNHMIAMLSGTPKDGSGGQSGVEQGLGDIHLLVGVAAVFGMILAMRYVIRSNWSKEVKERMLRAKVSPRIQTKSDLDRVIASLRRISERLDQDSDVDSVDMLPAYVELELKDVLGVDFDESGRMRRDAMRERPFRDFYVWAEFVGGGLESLASFMAIVALAGLLAWIFKFENGEFVAATAAIIAGVAWLISLMLRHRIMPD